MKRIFIPTVVLILLMCLLTDNVLAQNKVLDKFSNSRALKKTTADSSLSLINIGNITSWVGSNGFHPPEVYSGSFNGIFPVSNYSDAGVIYQEGIVWGGIVDDGILPSLRVGGNTYNSGTTQLTRIVRVRPDYKTADLQNDAASFFLTYIDYVTQIQIEQIYDQYAKDWQEWPAALGAPFKDINNDGIYEPSIDIPGIPDASQTIFISYDDRNSVDVYGSPPIGIQVNETIWGYSKTGPLRDAIFKKVDLIYKGTSSSKTGSKIDSMYLVQWADPDIGSSGDDYAGCDSTLNLGYAYNSTPFENNYFYHLNIPAVGYVMLQGVSEYTGIPSDSAMFNLSWRHGYKYVNKKPLSTFVYFSGGGYGGQWRDPPFTYEGSLQWYNLMRGYLPVPPYPERDPFPSPFSSVGGDGTYLLPGDPIQGTGWIDGQIENAGDRRICNITGPFSLSLGDTVEIVVSEVGGYVNYFTASPNLFSLKNLKENSSFVTQYLNTKAAAFIKAPDIANVDTIVNLSVTYLPSDAQVNSISWSLDKKPTGSNAQFGNIQNLSASFTPDKTGDYEIAFKAIVNGNNVTAAKQLIAIINHIPVADIIAEKDTIEWGDSVLVDYSKSFDADNDSLTYKFSGAGVFSSKVELNRTLYFSPDPSVLGKTTISLNVNDKYSYDSTTLDIFVKPKYENIEIEYSYVDTGWYFDNFSGLNSNWRNFYFKGSDSLFVPMINSLRRYEITNTGVEFKEEYPNIKCNHIWSINNNLLFGRVNVEDFTGTVPKLSIFDLSNGGNNLLSGYLPGSSQISNIFQIDGYYYIQDYNNIYKIDFSNPSIPQVINSVHLDTSLNFYNGDFLASDENYLYYWFHGFTKLSIKLYDKNNLNAAGEIELPLNTPNNWRVVSKNDTIVCYSAKQYDIGIDSIYFYKLNNDLSITLLKKIFKPSIFSNPDQGYYSRFEFYWDASFLDNFLRIYSYYGGYQKLFDISDLNNIKSVASWYGGYLNFIKQKDNYYLINDPYHVNQFNPYSGINKITLNYINGDDSNNLPLIFKLAQNYPNPFNPKTTIKFDIAEQSDVSLKIYDILGEEVATLKKEILTPGRYTVEWDASKYSSGVYFYQLKAANFTEAKKMLLLK
jgi:hypothetical protein